jgi:hypothetical protein
MSALGRAGATAVKPWFVVEGELDYTHRFQVGIQAADAEQAEAIAEEAMNQGTLFDDVPDMPLLMDRYEEDEDSGSVLQFRVISSPTQWPVPADRSVLLQRAEIAAMACAQALVTAYARAEQSDGGSVDWSDIDDAYALARQAVGIDLPDHCGARIRQEVPEKAP